jgi:hypothetical protein
MADRVGGVPPTLRILGGFCGIMVQFQAWFGNHL